MKWSYYLNSNNSINKKYIPEILISNKENDFGICTLRFNKMLGHPTSKRIKIIST